MLENSITRLNNSYFSVPLLNNPYFSVPPPLYFKYDTCRKIGTSWTDMYALNERFIAHIKIDWTSHARMLHKRNWAEIFVDPPSDVPNFSSIYQVQYVYRSSNFAYLNIIFFAYYKCLKVENYNCYKSNDSRIVINKF